MMWKFVHVLGAVLLLGNVIATGLWSHWALARRDTAISTFATVAILRADLWLTLVGGAMLTIAGIEMVRTEGLSWDLPWLRLGLYALAASTAIWLVLLLPIQFKLIRLAKQGPAQQDRLWRWFLYWSLAGWADTGLLLWGLWAMVSK
jgi:uncharacterized membrane protein